jgi:uncharacterized membrane protein
MPLVTRKHRIAYIIMAFFATIFCAISLVNHYNFRTYALDLGLHNHAMFDYRSLRFNYSTLIQPKYFGINQLGDHFDLMVALLAPFSYIFGSATLLLAQITAIVFGGFGMYLYFKEKCAPHSNLPYLALFHFYSIWGIYSALAFDYHSSVIGAMLVPWYIYYFSKQNSIMSLLFFVLIIICKETMALWLFFIHLGLLFEHRKNKVQLIRLVWFGSISIIYFIFMLGLVIPAFSNTSNGYIHFEFEVLGKNPFEAIKTILHQFQLVITYLFESHLTERNTVGIKTELHLFVLISGGFALFLKPQYLIMLIPIYAQKLFNNDPTKWGLNSHYSIEFVPIIVFALYSWIIDTNFTKPKQLIAFTFLIICVGSTYSSLEKRCSIYYEKEQANFLDISHYKQSFDGKNIHTAIAAIPSDAKVSASTALVPHLSFRKVIYQFPWVADANLIILMRENSHTYPLSKENFETKIKELKNDSLNYVELFNKDNLLIFKRRDYTTPIIFNN